MCRSASCTEKKSSQSLVYGRVLTWADLVDPPGRWVAQGDGVSVCVEADEAQALELGELGPDLVQPHRLDLDGAVAGAKDDRLLAALSVLLGQLDVLGRERLEEGLAVGNGRRWAHERTGAWDAVSYGIVVASDGDVVE